MTQLPARPDRHVLLRAMQASDAAAVAALHATNWRANYREVLSAAYLVGDVERERMAVWTSRLTGATDRAFGIVAEADGRLIGFAYVIGNADPEFGNVLENLHVEPGAQGKGLGRLLLRRVVETLESMAWAPRLYLWVYTVNGAARRFYERLGAREQGRELLASADGGQVLACRYVWPDTSTALREGPVVT